MEYRPEIDGLRALAVTPVVLFHAGVPGFTGGYVGVDVFFVISGFLITTLLLEEQARTGRIDLFAFYGRRARRILPALFAVLGVVTVAAYHVFDPVGFRAFGKSLLATLTFLSNFHFWQTIDYFDPVVETRALVHTWSLAVEEQFYLVYPLLLSCLPRQWLRVALPALLVASLAFAEAFARLDATGAFYLFPSRAWELLLGAIVAMHSDRIRGLSFIRRNPGSLTMIGVLAIAGSVGLYEPGMRFPGLVALLPTLGAALVLVCGESPSPARTLLASRPAIAVGLVSYSAYLWHQPLIAYAHLRYGAVDTLRPALALAVVTSFALATLTYHAIERPFRKGGSIARPRLLLGSTWAVLGLCALIVAATEPPREGTQLVRGVRITYDTGYAGVGVERGIGAVPDRPEVVLYGDSHALQYYPALTARAAPATVRLIAEPACMALPGVVNRYDGVDLERAACLESLEALRAVLADETPPALLVIAYRWDKELVSVSTASDLGETTTSASAREAMLDALEFLLHDVAAATRVIVVGSVPSAAAAGPDMHRGFLACSAFVEAECPLRYPREQAEGALLNDALEARLSEMERTHFVDPRDQLCDEAWCHVVLGPHLLYSDEAHLTRRGARRVIAGLPPLPPLGD